MIIGAAIERVFVFMICFVLTILVAAYSYADTIYIVKRGDNPSRIAKKFKVSVRDILEANTLNPRRLRPGTELVIPLNKKETPRKSTLEEEKEGNLRREKETANDVKESRSEDDNNNSLYHMVRKGDSLFSISRKYSVTVTGLREMNDLKSERLKIGQRLIIRLDKPRTYTVKKGDTLWDIGRRFDADFHELMAINSLETDSLHPGQEICLEARTESYEAKHYEAMLSQAHPETAVEKVSETSEMNGLGLQERLILFAKKLLDIPYRFGGNNLLGIDCSAYVKKVYGLVGIDLPRSARAQFKEGKPVHGNELTTGDLVFFRTYASFPSHVGIYLGNNLFIHASSRSKKVTIDSLNTPYYLKRFIGAKRFIEIKDEQISRGEG